MYKFSPKSAFIECNYLFSNRIQVAEKTYKDSFDDELEQFKARIRKRAAEKIQEAIKEQEDEEREARLGPGGLDPIEVYEELPDVSKILQQIACSQNPTQKYFHDHNNLQGKISVGVNNILLISLSYLDWVDTYKNAIKTLF